MILDQYLASSRVVNGVTMGGEGNLRPRRPPREYLGEYTS